MQTYAVHLKDVVRKTESSYKLTTQNNTVEYCLKGLEPGGHYSVSVRLRNMSKEASYTLNTSTARLMSRGRARSRSSLLQPTISCFFFPQSPGEELKHLRGHVNVM